MEFIHLGPQMLESLSMPEQANRDQAGADGQKAEPEIACGRLQIHANFTADLMEEQNQREPEADQRQGCPNSAHEGLVEGNQGAFECEGSLPRSQFERGRRGRALAGYGL